MADLNQIELPNGVTYNFRDNTKLPISTAGGIASCSGGGSNWYYHIATIVITTTYMNRPVVFEISGRNKQFSRLQIQFTNSNTTDPALQYFSSDGDNEFYIKKTTTSTWEVYGKYSEQWGMTVLHRITGAGADIGITVVMSNIGTTLPSDTTQVTYIGNVAYATNAGTVNGHTVAKDVPSNAVFTDNNTTYTFSGGNDGFSVTPSGGSAQNVGVKTYRFYNSDTRSDNQLPSWYMTNYGRSIVEEFKGCSTIGVNTVMTGTYCTLTTFIPWNDSSGGRPVQIALSDSGVRAQRVATADATWGSWIALPNQNTNTTYTFANGTNGFTVTPSGGSAQTVTVTPSIANNVTGSGTSGCIAKFNGTNTVTDGPAFGSSITNFLAENGQWRTPTDNKVRQNYIEDTVEKSYMLLLGENDSTYPEYSTTETTGTKKAIGLNYCIRDGLYRRLMISATEGSQTRSIELRPMGTSTIPTLQVSNSLTADSIYTEGDIFSEGNIDCDGNMSANSVTCNSMSVTDISSQYTFSKTSGNWSIQSFEVWRMGNFIQMRITFKGNGSNVASGSNGFVGAITGGAIPVCESKLTGYYGGMTCITNISKEGNITARVCGGTSTTIPASGAMGVAGYFLTND